MFHGAGLRPENINNKPVEIEHGHVTPIFIVFVARSDTYTSSPPELCRVPDPKQIYRMDRIA